MNNTNWLAILVSAIAGFAIGFLWYGLLFQNQWMAGNGITMSDDNSIMYKNGVEVAMSNMPMIVNTIGMLVLAIVINWFINISNHTTAIKGLIIGLMLGVVATINIVLTNLFANNPFSLSLVDSSYIIVLAGVMGLILGAWRK